jgi:hypothetical protein
LPLRLELRRAPGEIASRERGSHKDMAQSVMTFLRIVIPLYLFV